MNYFAKYHVFPVIFHVVSRKVDYLCDSVVQYLLSIRIIIQYSKSLPIQYTISNSTEQFRDIRKYFLNLWKLGTFITISLQFERNLKTEAKTAAKKTSHTVKIRAKIGDTSKSLPDFRIKSKFHSDFRLNANIFASKRK